MESVTFDTTGSHRRLYVTSFSPMWKFLSTHVYAELLIRHHTVYVCNIHIPCREMWFGGGAFNKDDICLSSTTYFNTDIH